MIVSRILEFIQPKPKASLNQAHSIHFAKKEDRRARNPITIAALSRCRLLKRNDNNSNPITITRIDL